MSLPEELPIPALPLSLPLSLSLSAVCLLALLPPPPPLVVVVRVAVLFVVTPCRGLLVTGQQCASVYLQVGMPPPVSIRSPRPPAARDAGGREPTPRPGDRSERGSEHLRVFFACSEHGKKKYEIEKAVSPVLHTGAGTAGTVRGSRSLLPVRTNRNSSTYPDTINSR
eukprot:COSAG02_NODE_917_length_15956_cov_356.844990_1_plen_168_part_00